jgi:outer membrane protein OmpA-like peptidoglycan-associated protein
MPLGNPALPDLAIPALAVPLPPGAAAGGMAVIADAAPLPDLGFGLTPLMPVAPIGDVAALAQPVPPPALMPLLPSAPPPPPAQMSVPTSQKVAHILPPVAAVGQSTLVSVFVEMLQQSQATVTIVPPLAGMPAASPPNVVVSGLGVGVGFAELEAAGVVPLQSLSGLPIFEISPTVVTFHHSSSSLSAEARNQIHQVVDAYKENGGKIRVVGHASQRTGDMALDDHLRINFRISANRAGAVASELMRLGVDPSALTIDAVGDAQPQFLESMPAGEAGNRRVEIFVEA